MKKIIWLSPQTVPTMHNRQPGDRKIFTHI